MALTRVSMNHNTIAVTNAKGEPGLVEYLPLRTAPVILKNGSKSVRINALLDDGSTRSCIKEDVAECLGLERELVSLCV